MLIAQRHIISQSSKKRWFRLKSFQYCVVWNWLWGLSRNKEQPSAENIWEAIAHSIRTLEDIFKGAMALVSLARWNCPVNRVSKRQNTKPDWKATAAKEGLLPALIWSISSYPRHFPVQLHMRLWQTSTNCARTFKNVGSIKNKKTLTMNEKSGLPPNREQRTHNRFYKHVKQKVLF